VNRGEAEKQLIVEEREERSRPPYPDDPVGSTRRNFGTFGAN
jgi:hypothetical protein